MKTGILALFVLVLLSGLGFADDHESDQIVIRLAPGTSIDTINTRYATTTTSEIVTGQTFKVRVPDPNQLDSKLQQMQQDADLTWSELSYENIDPTLCSPDSTDCVEDAQGSRRTLAVIDGDPTPSKYHDQGAFIRIKAAEAHNYSTGAGVLVAVIDTGVDYDHPDLTDHVLRDPNTNQVIGKDYVDNDDDPMDSTDGIDNDGDGLIDEATGHGTHVAGIIALIAPGAKIVPIRILDTEGSGTADHVAEAINWFMDPNNPALAGYTKKVVNLSLGIPNVDRVEVIHQAMEPEDLQIPTPTVVASSGNDNSPIVHYPAKEGDAFSIAAVGPDDVKADFSNFDRVIVSAPGVGIYSTFIRDQNGNPQWAWWSGTSMSTPFVTGEIALIKAVNGNTPNLENLVKQAVDDISGKNPGIDLGSGRINLLKAVQQASSITIKKAVYKTKRQRLVVKAISKDAPADVLSVQNYGTMTHKPGTQTYIFKMTVPAPAPATVTVTSSVSSSQITANVIVK